MNTSQLQCMIECDPKLRQFVLGVFPADKLPKIRADRPFSLICNTHVEVMPGEHWCAIYRDVDGRMEFFDSYGRPPKENSVYIEQWLKRYSKTLNMSNVQLQSEHSNVCGLYCILYLHQRSLGVTLNEFINAFDECNLHANDEYVFDTVSNAYSQCLKNENIHNQICASRVNFLN